MNKSIFILLLFSLNLSAQYLIPDIAAPGMNVYVEIIGPESERGRFGSDGLYLNNSGDNTQVRIANTDLRDDVKVGPLVVSWDGRMISTQIFVNPTLEPNSTRWDQLNGDFTTFIEVIVGGSSVQQHIFYIVEPQSLGDISSNPERVLGEGDLGFRSPRGAMIVDSLILANDTYTISLQEPDADSSNGVQAYLPFILLSKGPVRGSGSSSLINANAAGVHGGPGGGGGGGRFCDNTSTNSVGGNGFTGGSGGGQNKSNPFWFSGRSKRNFGGFGTGSPPSTDTSFAGGSLNGVVGSYNGPEVYQSSGGGTGHPFGQSANANQDDGSLSNGEGRYGGGGGGIGGSDGGGAGYATNGQDEMIPNGGEIHGNIMGVPLAGGSGGGGGNPQTLSGCAGSGGGGGGAIRIFASEINLVAFSANGNGGGNSSNGDGGGGSGGHIEISSKLELSNVGGTALSDGSGGSGRVRLDGRQNAVISFASGSQFVGPTTDTVTFADLSFVHRGTKNENETVRYFIKRDDSDWSEIPGVSDNVDEWELLVDLPEGNDFYYISVLQTVSNNSTDEYLFEPEFIFSQASANIVQTEKYPIISTVDESQSNLLACKGIEVFDSVLVENTGNDNLFVEFENATWTDPSLNFVVISPQSNTFLLPDEAIYLKIRYFNDQQLSGEISNTLVVPNNDPNINRSPRSITFTVNIDDPEYEFLDENDNVIDTLQIDVCTNQVFDTFYKIRNAGNIESELTVISSNGNAPIVAITPSDGTISVNETINIQIPVNSTGVQPGIYYEKFYFETAECETIIDSLDIKVNVLSDTLTLISANDGDFGDVRVGTTNQITLSYQNTSSGTFNLTEAPNPPGPFSFISSNPTIPTVLEPGDQIEFTYEFAPASNVSSTYRVELDINNGVCDNEISHLLRGNGADTDLRYPNVLGFGARMWCQFAREDLVIENLSNTIPVEITDLARIEGLDQIYFGITQQLAVGTIIQPNSSVTYSISFDPSIEPNGIKNDAQLVIPLDTPEGEIRIDLFAIREGLNFTISPDTLDFGDVPVGYTSTPINLSMTNNSIYFSRLLRDYFEKNDFSINPITQNFDLSENHVIEVSFIANAPGLSEGELALLFDIGAECPDTLYIPYRANGIEGALEFDPIDTLDFGTFNICNRQDLRSIEISNVGDAAVTINSAQIIIDPYNVYGINDINGTIINPGNSIDLNVDFNGSLNYVDFNGIVEISYEQNGIDLTQQIILKASIENAIDLPDTLDFGEVFIGNTANQTLQLNEKNNWEIVTLDINDPVTIEFIINENLHDNVDVQGSYPIGVQFSPTAVGPFNDEVQISYIIDADCSENQIVYLTGNGTLGFDLTIKLPDLFLDPSADNVSIAVYGFIEDETDPIQFEIDSLELKFNRTVFHPENIQNGDFIRNEYDQDDLVLVVNTNQITVSPNDSLLFSLDGAALLGQIRRSDLVIDNVSLNDSRFVGVNVTNGSIELDICEEGGERLILNNDQIALDLIISNDLTDLLLEMRLLEAGQHVLSISSLNGKRKILHTFNRKIDDNNIMNFTIQKNELVPGVYFLELKGPWRSVTKKVIITE